MGMSMYGFRIKHNNETFAVALENGCVSCFVESLQGDRRISVGGCDRQGRDYQWYGCRLRPGDDIEISFEDIAESEIPAARILDFTKPEDRKAKMIEEYRRLRQALVEDGLL